MDPVSIVGGALAGEAFKRSPIGERMMGILDYIGLAPQEKPAPVEERNPPVMTQARPDTANRNPMIPIDQAPVSPDPMNQGINQDMAGFAQSQSDLPMVQQKVGQRAQQLMQEVPEEKRNTKEAQDGAFALSVAENAQVAANAKDQEGIQNTLKKAFGNEEMWLTLALGFNSMRMRPDAGLAGVIGKRLESIRAGNQQNKTAQMLLQSTDPKQQAIGKMMLSGVSYKDALDMSKETDFDKKWRLAGSDLEAYNKYFGSKGTTVTVGGAGSKGLEEVDKAFGKDWSTWTQGGAASTRKNLGTLRTVIDSIKSGKNLSGTLIGLAPDQGLNLFAPEAKAARDRVAGVVQQSLKDTLGAQFTEKEAAQLIQRAYDPALDETENLARLEALALMIESAAKAKKEAMDYFGKDFTMLGFQQTEMPTVQDFYDAMDQAASRITPFRQGESTKIGTVKTFTTADGTTANYSKVKEGPDSDPSTWKKVD
jgi:hypothetical protein